MSSALAQTAVRAVKARTRTSAPGNERARRGFTLVELLVVLALIALATGAAALALRDGDADRLERDGLRLAALLEAARAEARASALPVRFRLATRDEPSALGPPPDFHFDGMPATVDLPVRWLEPGTTGTIEGGSLRLGPEPLIGAQRIVLGRGEWQITLQTDGLGPFTAAAPTRAAGP